MSASPKLRIGIAATALSCLFAGYVAAQQQTVRDPAGAGINQPNAQDPGAGQIDRTNGDRAQIDRREYTANFRGDPANAGAQHHGVQRYVVACLLTKNQGEVEMGKFAQQHSQNPQVKEFAQQMVQEHGKLVQKLQGLSGNQAGDRIGAATNANPDAAVRDATTDRIGTTPGTDLAANRAAGGNAAIEQLITLEKQIADRCLQNAKEELQQKQGAEFDKAYIGSQIAGHMQMLAAVEVLGQQGPEQVQQLAQQAQPTVKKHLDHAKQIMEQLESGGLEGSRAARQPSTTQRE